MASKREKIHALLAELGVTGEGNRAYYEGYFVCFNQQLYYEAHEVLEELWQPNRQQPNGDFFRGLIQLAGAFVHLQKQKREPALRLLRMGRENLAKYGPEHEGLEIGKVLALIEEWIIQVERAQPVMPQIVPQIPWGRP